MSLISLNSIELQLYTDEEVRKIAVVQVKNSSTYDRGLPKANGVNDARMGVTDKALQCPTCGLTATCNNHYGFIELERPVIRLGHISSALCLLRCVCWACSRPKFTVTNEDGFVDIRAIIAKTLPGSKDRLRNIADACKNRFRCPHINGEKPCGAPQPVYSRVNKLFFGRTFRPKESSLFMCEEESQYASRRLLPDEIQSIIRHIPHDALILLGYKPTISHPENYIYKAQLVPPPSIRPATSAGSTEARMRGENDLTVALQDIVRANNDFAFALSQKDNDKIQIAWDKLQIFCAALINQNAKKLNTFNGTPVIHARAMGKRKTKVLKDRLTGKKGRLRGNLSGKRVDQAGRTVVGPDSSHDIFQLGVPSSIMRTLTFPEHVNKNNLSILCDSVINGANMKNGALTVRMPQSGSDEKVLYLSLLDSTGRKQLASQLQPGWIVERHLKNGDWVLFNRQPSLHKASIMAFQAYEINSLQFKLPLPCTKPFNADFDGDEMNIHALQDYSAIAEAQEIMSVPHQMVTPQNNSVIISLVQDSIVGSYMISSCNSFVNRERAMQLFMKIKHCPNSKDYTEMPTNNLEDTSIANFEAPAILKGTKNGKHYGPLWTGKQIFSWMLPHTLNISKGINGGDVKSIEDIFDEKVVIVRNGQLVCGRLCKQTVGNTSSGIVYELWKQYSPWSSAKFVSDAQRVLMEWLKHDTLCISIKDCLTESGSLVDDITREAMIKVNDLETSEIPKAVKEVRQTQILQETLRTVGATVLENMNTKSGIATVVASGSKGNLMNIAQIAGLVGQQTINGLRIPFRNGPVGQRTLANFAPNDNSAQARGFVASSYMMGLKPHEFFFHQQAGREGVVATAVSTADTGYNQRRMVKNQESEVIAYDLSVRVSSNLIVQQHYGGDDYDGTFVERVKLSCLSNETIDSLLCKQTGKLEKIWISRAFQLLKKIKHSIYFTNDLFEISMPANFFKILTSVKIASISNQKKSKLANVTVLLKKLLIGIRKAHNESVFENDSIDELLFWDKRDWRMSDDPGLQARLCLALQCTTKMIHAENICENDIDYIVSSFLRVYMKGIVNPGEGVGAVGSSSIGEPSTQMTLNIFHYSGIAEKNVTLTGLPRFKQIINAVDTYDTANMKIHFTESALGTSSDSHKFNARTLSSRLVKTGLVQIVKKSCVVSIENDSLDIQLSRLTAKSCDVENGSSSKIVEDRISSIIGQKGKSDKRLSTFTIVFTLEKSAIVTRHLSIDDIGTSLHFFMGNDAVVTWSAKWENEWTIVIHPPTWSSDKNQDKIVTEAIHDALLEHCSVGGIDTIKKAVPIFSDNKWIVETEGSDIIEVAHLNEVDALNTCTNNIQEVLRVLGVEAAICLMQSELHRVLSFDGSYVDPRHTWLLSDTVARSGSINPLNRHKMEELGGSLLQCASFEQTLDVFEHGAAFGKSDHLGGATEKLIVGQPVHVGTGSFAILEQNDTEDTNVGTFVAPLFTDEDDQICSSRVAPLTSLISKESTFVTSLQKESKPIYNGTILHSNATDFKPPSDLPSFVFESCLHSSIIPLIQTMRKKAQTREPVWLIINIEPVEDKISNEEFGDIEQNLESYTGWTQKTNSRGSHFLQYTEVEYSTDKLNVISRVEYNQHAVKSIHRTKSVLLKSTTQLEQPFEAWTICNSAIEWTEIDKDNLPTTVTPTSVKILHEKIFEKGPWLIRLVRSWLGNNIIEAEQKQRGGSKSCTFSISVELIKPWELIEERGSTDINISGAFIQRIMACLESIK